MADEPMTDERLAEIRTRLEALNPGAWTHDAGFTSHIWNGTEIIAADVPERNAPFLVHAPEDMRALLAEVERLRAREAAMRPIVEMVATGGVITTGNANTSITGPVLLNAFADLPALHEQAKAWLASQPPSPDDA